MPTPAPATALTWFEIGATDYERAVAFYETTLDTKLTRDKMGEDDFAQFPAAEGGVPGCVMSAKWLKPGGSNTLVYLLVDDLEAAVARAANAGGQVAFPKTELPGELGHMAQIIDTEGNLVGLHQLPRVA